MNASRVIFEDIAFIATQAPMIAFFSGRTETLSHFIDMTLASGSKTIVTLLNKAESGKADPYWEGNQPLDGDRWLVCEKQEPLVHTPRGERLVKRTLLIKDKNQIELDRVTQFHYEHWPDHGPPNEELFNDFLTKIEKHAEKGPLVTHCSAGVGRTGTFIAALGLRKKMREQLAKDSKTKPTVNMAQVILELRLQRNGMIQSASQISAIEAALKTHYQELTA
nr:tyrosine-protein phosphatase [Estrella lausannensis]